MWLSTATINFTSVKNWEQNKVIDVVDVVVYDKKEKGVKSTEQIVTHINTHTHTYTYTQPVSHLCLFLECVD